MKQTQRSVYKHVKLISTYFWEIGEFFQVRFAPVYVAVPSRRMAARQQVHCLALVGVGHDPPPYARDHGHHVAAAVEVGFGNHLNTLTKVEIQMMFGTMTEEEN